MQVHDYTLSTDAAGRQTTNDAFSTRKFRTDQQDGYDEIVAAASRNSYAASNDLTEH